MNNDLNFNERLKKSMDTFNSLIKLGRYSDAENYIRLNDQDPRVCYILGGFYKNRGDVKKAILEYFNPVLEKIDIDLGRYSLGFELLYHTIKNPNLSRQAFSALSEIINSDNHSIELKKAMYLFLVRVSFIHNDVVHYPEIMYVKDKVLQSIEMSSKFEFDNSFSKSRNVILSTSQFLSPGHAPTLVLLNLANELKKLGYNPIFLVTNSLYVENAISKASIHGFNYIKEYELENSIFFFGESGQINYLSNNERIEGKYIEYQNSIYEFITLDKNNSDDDKINSILNYISKYKATVITLAVEDIYMDIAAKYTEVYALPCSTSLPFVFNIQSLITRPLNKMDLELTKHLKFPLIEGYMPRQPKFIFNRKNKRAHDLSFVMIGNRLSVEIESRMLSRINRILSYYPEAKFNFIGLTGDEDICNELNKMSKNMIYHGFLYNSDYETVIRACDYTLNPPRIGGGGGVAEAIQLNVYPISFKFGDGYAFCGDYFSFDSDDEVISFIDNIEKSEKKSHYIESADIECERLSRSESDYRSFFNLLTRGTLPESLQ